MNKEQALMDEMMQELIKALGALRRAGMLNSYPGVHGGNILSSNFSMTYRF